MKRTARDIAEMEMQWRAWLKDNPEADSHQRYYAAGVVDGLKFATTGEPFVPDWKQVLATDV